MISFSDFKKIDLRVGKIENVEEVEGLDKLYKLTVDIGSAEKRTLLAGIKKTHQPDELLGKSVVVVVNLEPREIKGIRSEGMLLAASSSGRPVLITPEKEINPGCEIS
jgi:methionyl-tRNA synthetase